MDPLVLGCGDPSLTSDFDGWLHTARAREAEGSVKTMQMFP